MIKCGDGMSRIRTPIETPALAHGLVFLNGGAGSAKLDKPLCGVREAFTLASKNARVDGADVLLERTASSWAALVNRVFEVDPLKCPHCGSKMKVVSFIERRQRDIVEKMLRGHQSGAMVCGLWDGPLRTLATARSPPGSGDSGREPAEPRELQLVLARIFHPFLLWQPKSFSWLRYVSVRDPQRVANTTAVANLTCLATKGLEPPRDETVEICGLDPEYL